jgi:hypothetical protein
MVHRVSFSPSNSKEVNQALSFGSGPKDPLERIDKLIPPNLDLSRGQPNWRHHSDPPAASEDEKRSFASYCCRQAIGGWHLAK